MWNRHVLALSLLLLATYLSAVRGAPVSACSQESSNPTYHSTVSEVRLVFFAVDENNHPVEELRRDGFAVVDDERVIRDFRSFSRSSSAKLDVIVLIDSSESVLPRFQTEMAEVGQLISQWPWAPGDSLSMLSFGGMQATLLCSQNCRTAFHADQIASLPTGGATPLFDAVDTAAALLANRRQPDTWPVIILFSDGNDTISRTSFPEMLERVVASGAQVYAIDLARSGQPSNGTALLQKIADDSGGRRLGINDGPVQVFRDIIDDLRTAWIVTYSLPSSTSAFHSIRILPTHNLNLQFRCRRGYYRDSGSARREDIP